MLKTLYTIAIGLLFAAFVGFGFQTFYPQPKAPEYPASLNNSSKPLADQTIQEKAIQKQYDQAQKDFQDKFDVYNRNLSVWLILASLIILAVSILGLGNINVIGDGLTLGGVFTLFYGLVRTFMAGDEKVRFIAVTLGLIILIFLAYWKFVRQEVVKK
jgi:hypothetical protein